MTQTKTFSVALMRVALFAALLLITLSLVACGAEPTPVAQAPTVAEATATQPPEPTTAPTATATTAPTDTPAPTDTATPTEAPPTPTPTATPVPIDDTGCITCHTSEESLQALATEEEELAVESEGEG